MLAQAGILLLALVQGERKMSILKKTKKKFLYLLVYFYSYNKCGKFKCNGSNRHSGGIQIKARSGNRIINLIRYLDVSVIQVAWVV